MKHTRRRLKAVIMLFCLCLFAGLLLLVNSNKASEFFQAGHQYCDINPCKHGGTCISYGNSYTCICKSGYFGVNCHLDYLHCENNPCQHGGTCMSHGSSYTCQCKQGHYGVNCHLDIDECKSGPCQNGGTCKDQENGYICECGPGYSGTYCEMVNSTNGNV
ncbi:hypothetical protein CHS0354_035908 [Potamilus streckersoni]|uniref:EGF-like domain-containing protein n=1 Tax=Potamilus streckersoni TaxID=2493646 RepID=A0AAE0SFH6_9BIVA|nr:hypothetical protein CHS0354_035908 [Potamilus streckersoni]